MSNINFLAEIDRLREEKQRLIQALEDVREIANKRNVGCGKFCEVNRKEHNCNAECNAYYLKQIQDKINEVLEDEIHN